MSDYDNPWKEALGGYFEPFLALFFPRIHAGIDWRRDYQALDQELRQVVREAVSGLRRVDHLVKLWLRDGREQWVLVHVEVQTTPEREFARRMFTYNCRLIDRYNREVVSLAVLADDNPRWRPDRFGYGRWGWHIGIRFPMVKLLDYAAEWEVLRQSSNPFASVLLAHLGTLRTRRDPQARRAAKIQLVKGLYGRGWAADDVRRFFAVIDWMMDLPKPLDLGFWEEIKHYEEEKQMAFMTTPERIGREEGLAQGRTQGLSQGIELGLELKFGQAGLELMPEIRAIEDEAKLAAVLQALRTAASVEDLRRVWTDKS